MVLFFDTETTGLPKRYKAPVTDLENWPRLVELAWTVHDETGQELRASRHVVCPDGFVIPEQASRVHGITQDIAVGEGEPLAAVLQLFAAEVAAARVVVGHNVSFDEMVVGAEFLRVGLAHELWYRERICTKTESTDFCALPGPYGYKWPTLQELHQHLFGTTFGEAHTALADVRATARCYFELKRLGVI